VPQFRSISDGTALPEQRVRESFDLETLPVETVFPINPIPGSICTAIGPLLISAKITGGEKMVKRMLNRWRQLSTAQRVHIRLWFFFACILGLMLMVTWFARQQTIPPGVKAGQWEIGRMPIAEFETALSGAIEALARQPVVIRSPADSRALTITYGELGLTTNAEEIRQAIDGLSKGSLLNRAHRRWFMRYKAFPLVLVLSEERLEKAVNAHWEAQQQAMPTNARRVVDSHDNIRLEPDVPAYRIDTVELLSRLDREMHTFFYAKLDKKLLDSSKPAEIELPLRTLQAEITLQELESQRVNRKIYEFSTTLLSSSGGRRYNVDSTAKVLNDTLLAPGEIFDYSKIIEQTRKQFGYRQAPVIYDGQLVPGIGGGICQISTTLYNAVLRVGLEIVERRNHSLPISYAPLGLDATYSTGYINFRFRNTLDSYLLIRSELVGNQVIVKLFGEMDPAVRYTIETKVVGELAPPVKYVHNPSLPAGAQKVVRSGRKGYVVETYRTKWVNGKQAETEQISRDRYQPQPTVIAVNQSKSGLRNKVDPDSNRKPIVEDGVFGPIY
jgi:vancomycin resistance protein YoaR